MKIVYLSIITWRGISLDAEHYYGRLECGEKSIELEHELTTKQAIGLNKKARETGWDEEVWKKGDYHSSFDTEQEIIDLAIKTWRTHFSGDMLVLGRAVYSDPQLVLDGPENIKKQVNEFVRKFNKLDDGQHKDEMYQLSDEFWMYWQEIGALDD